LSEIKDLNLRETALAKRNPLCSFYLDKLRVKSLEALFPDIIDRFD